MTVAKIIMFANYLYLYTFILLTLYYYVLKFLNPSYAIINIRSFTWSCNITLTQWAMFFIIYVSIACSPDTHSEHGSWLLQWSKNQQVPLRPSTLYQVNQLHSGLPEHMSWQVPTITSCTRSRLLSSVMSQVDMVNTEHSSGEEVGAGELVAWYWGRYIIFH